MDKRAMDVAYLNQFLGNLWPGISDILQSEVTHRAFKQMRGQPYRMSRRRTGMDLSAYPEVLAKGTDAIRVRIPGSGANRFSTRIFLLPRLPFPRMNADVDIEVDVTITAESDPDTRISASVHSNLLGTAIDRLADWKGRIRESFTGEDFEREIGYFRVARYAPSAVPKIPEPVRVYPDRRTLDHAVNIVLVPESFSQDHFSRFDQMVDAVVQTLSLPNDSHANEPYYSFKTALNVWTIKPDQSPDGDHVMGSFVDPRGHRRVALANLARLAAIGRAAESVGPGVSILVFVVNPAAPRFGGRRPTAMSLGNVIMQPLQETPREDGYLLLHELAHTGLARLGDEYVLRSLREERYLGKSPNRPNLTADESLGKWSRWIDHPALLPDWDDHPIGGVEGAGYYGSGIWRPAERCAMRESKDGVPFCAVCRETLTKGIRQTLAVDEVLLRVDYPTGDQEYLHLISDGSNTIIGEIQVPDDQDQPISVTPVAGSIPEPWTIAAEFTGGGDFQEQVDESPEAGSPMPRTRYTVTAIPGDLLRIQIRSTCQFTPWDPTPPIQIELRFAGR